MACNCGKNKSGCNCKKVQSMPDCSHKEQPCIKGDSYKWCDEEVDNCGSPVCHEVDTQIDTSEVYYKLKGNCFSNLEELSITNGSNLEFILEQFGQYIYDWQYLQIPHIEGEPQITTFQSLIEHLVCKIKAQEAANLAQQAQINQTNQNLLNLTNTVTSLMFPHIIDTKGRGFTINSDLKTILQKISDNG